MKKLILGLFVAFGLGACSLNTDDAPQDQCGTYTDVALIGFPLPCNYTVKNQTPNPSAIVIKTQEKMNIEFSTHANTCNNAINPAIDFSKLNLIGIYSGQKSTNGYGIKVTSIVENTCQVVVNFFEYGPQSGETINQIQTYPSDYVLIPATTKPIFFNKTNETPDKVIIGSFDGECTTTNCQKFIQLNDYNILKYRDVVYGSYAFDQYMYTSVTKRGDYTRFLKEIVTNEIRSLEGQTKTFGAPDTGDKKGIYFELHREGKITKIYIDNDDTADQTTEIKAFKKNIKDIITAIQ